MTNLVIGRSYQVPCVRAIWPDGNRVAWWPVLGPAHDDREIIGFDPEHWHVDFRFLPGQLTAPERARKTAQDCYVVPINHVYLDRHHPSEPLDSERLDLVPARIYHQVQARRYQGPYPSYIHVPWIRKLEAAYEHTTLKNGTVCPHKGADLSGILPNENGIITCPLHGLRWDIATRRMAPTPEDAYPRSVYRRPETQEPQGIGRP